MPGNKLNHMDKIFVKAESALTSQICSFKGGYCKANRGFKYSLNML